MNATKKQQEIYGKISDINQMILKYRFDISDLVEQLIETLPFKEGDIVLYYKDEPYFVSKIEPWDEKYNGHKYCYYGAIHIVLNKVRKDGTPSKRNTDTWIWGMKNINIPEDKTTPVRL